MHSHVVDSQPASAAPPHGSDSSNFARTRLFGGGLEGFLNRGNVEDHKLCQKINKESQTGTFTTSRGIKLCTRTFLPKDGKKPTALVFYHHGIQGHCHMAFEDKKGVGANDLLLGTNIRDKGWGAFFLDAEGHGFSEGTFCYIPSHMACVHDYLDYMQSVTEKYPGVPWVFSGESWGGNISLTAGLELQKMDSKTRENWKGIFLVAPAIVGDLPPCPVVFCLRYCCAPCCPKWTPFFMPNPVSASRIWKDEDARKYYTEVDELGGEGAAFRLGTAVSMLFSIENLQAQLEDIKYPFAVAHGDEDAAVLLDGSQLLYKKSSTSENLKALEIYKGGYHDLLSGPNKTQVVKFLLDWTESRVRDDGKEPNASVKSEQPTSANDANKDTETGGEKNI